MPLDPNDSGFKSRKFLFSVYAITLIFAAGVLCAKLAALATVYETMVGGIMGVTGAFLTGSIATKWVIGKALNDAKKTDAQKKTK